jgi:hypothetical protein
VGAIGEWTDLLEILTIAEGRRASTAEYPPITISFVTGHNFSRAEKRRLNIGL